jgi:hypothetical protein
MSGDLRHAVRGSRRTPAFTLVALATLALGFGANTAMCSIVHAVLWRPLPFADADRLVVLAEARTTARAGLLMAAELGRLARSERRVRVGCRLHGPDVQSHRRRARGAAVRHPDVAVGFALPFSQSGNRVIG